MRFKVDIHFNLKDLKINKVIRALVLADLFFWGGWGIINPIMALFIVGRVAGATVLTVGLASAMYWIVKAVFQIPVALYLDRLDGERGDFKALVFGLALAGFAAMTFPIISSTWGLFAAVFLQAIAYGLYTPSWSALFSRHLDRDHYAFDWSLDSTTIGIASGVAALVGGTIADLLGFNAVFILTSILSFVSAGVLLVMPGLVLPRVTTPNQPIIPEHTPGTPKM
ncbi:MAG: MFS transporter [Patescibacteria group bacterium]|nr:MFS transporter [Patescibacteria group bacterium]